MKIFKLIFFALAFISHPSNASDDDSIKYMLLVSKMTGACGVMQQMASFQSSTNMPGGSEFVERFWQTEFARLGKSQEEFIKECKGSIAAYNQIWEASEQLKE